MKRFAILPLVLAASAPAAAATAATAPDLTATGMGFAALAVFALAYLLVISEELTALRKSKPLVVAAGIIWVLVAVEWDRHGVPGVTDLLRRNLLEYAEVMLFLIAAMTYVNTLEERSVFAALRDWLLARGLSMRSMFWITGALAFCLSPVLDNLTTALIMGAVVMAVGRDHRPFVTVSCINVVVAANAGGAFSPFGDITTLMVWQKGIVGFFEFFALFIPSLVNWLVPAACMSLAVARTAPRPEGSRSTPKYGGRAMIGLFAATIVLTVSLHQFLHLPPFLGMMTGLGMLQIHGHFVRLHELRQARLASELSSVPPGLKPASRPFDIFISMKRIEWDTLLFFYGVVLCVGGLGALGYLHTVSGSTYATLGPTAANVIVGLASAIVDNIPIMFAVLSIDPEMSHGQWLLVTLTAGVGGSLLSIGSAAGVALMGLARGSYTFFSHLKWTWAIALGYAASIWAHFLINARLF